MKLNINEPRKENEMESIFKTLNTYYWDIIQERQSLSDLIRPDSWVESLIHFCNYAFERAGSPAAYRNSAKEAFRRNRSWLESRKHWSNNIEIKLFESFTQICQENLLKNFNLKNNPMGPSDGDLISMIRFVWYETKDESIASWALSSIENDDLSKVFNTLKKIRGVGNKISSFYLRDIYILSGRTNSSIKNRHLLQPIDVWTRRAARIFLDNQNASDKSCAEFLIGFEDKIEIVNGSSNIALWVLGSQIAENEETFTGFIKSMKQRNRDDFKRLLAKKISDERQWLTLLETVHNDL